MDQAKALAIGPVVLGVVMIVISLGADAFGLGARPSVIGWRQWLGAGVGVVLVGSN